MAAPSWERPWAGDNCSAILALGRGAKSCQRLLKALNHCAIVVQVCNSLFAMVTSLFHAQWRKYFSNPVSEPLGNILLISFEQNVYLCAFTNCFPGPRNLYNFNEGALSIYLSSKCIVFLQIPMKKNYETVNTLIISLYKKHILLGCSFGCCFTNYKQWNSSCG